MWNDHIADDRIFASLAATHLQFAEKRRQLARIGVEEAAALRLSTSRKLRLSPAERYGEPREVRVASYHHSRNARRGFCPRSPINRQLHGLANRQGLFGGENGGVPRTP